MTAYASRVESAADPSDMKAIVSGLQAFNAQHAGGDVPHYLVVSLRDEAGEIVGGLLGATYLGWLSVQVLWLPDAVRGRGYGRTLMGLAEQEAVRRGCPRVFLETLSFQALGFYEKLGYTVASTVPAFPPGGARYALTKMLEPLEVAS